MTKDDIANLLSTMPDTLSPADAFRLAEAICDIAYREQGGPTNDPDVSEQRWGARRRRNATGFEKLYCKLRDVAHDFHCEAVRRRDGIEPGQFDKRDCDPIACSARTFELAYERVADWDY